MIAQKEKKKISRKVLSQELYIMRPSRTILQADKNS